MSSSTASRGVTHQALPTGVSAKPFGRTGSRSRWQAAKVLTGRGHALSAVRRAAITRGHSAPQRLTSDLT